MPRRQTYLIQDPYDLDALRFIRTIETYFGVRPVCFYTNEKARFYAKRWFPALESDLVERSETVDVDDLATFASKVSQDFDVLGIVPYREDTVEIAAELCEHLELDWNHPSTLRIFRDKFALKTHVRRVDPSVRLPECRLVTTIEDLAAGVLPETFVIKPNDGFGNRAIGIFDSDELELVAQHISEHPGTTWILEEFIGGVEYHVDGHVRSDGTVTSLAVFEYLRAEVNGHPTVYLGEIQCSTDHPEFEALTDYAERLLRATGLRRCPFHLEAKLDERGPCVVDLGARLPSEGSGLTLSRIHRGRPDAYAVAAHDYLGSNSFASDDLDWTEYDRTRAVWVYGVSEEDGVITSVGGVDAVEAMPEFVRWAVPPEVGATLSATTELREAPYIVELSCAGDRDDALDLIAQVRSTVQWEVATNPLSTALGRFDHVREKASHKAAWMVHQARQRLW